MIVETVVYKNHKVNITSYIKLTRGIETVYYRARLTTHYDPATHKQIQKTLSGATVESVKQQIYQAFDPTILHHHYHNLHISVNQALNDFVDLRYARGNPRTYETKKSRIGSLRPLLKDISVQDLSQNDVQLVADLLSQKYKAPTVHAIMNILSMCMDEYVHRSQIPFNPCIDVHLPKLPPSKGVVLSSGQLVELMEELKKTPYYWFFHVLILTSTRVGECRGLTWDKVDESNRTITIDQQIHARNNTIDHFTKNNNPTTLTYSDEVFYGLHRAFEQQMDYIEQAGVSWSNPHSLIFTTPTGHPIPYENLRCSFKIAAESIGFRNLRIHDLRHTYASHLWEETHRMEIVQTILRHKTSATTRMYIHPTEKTHKECLRLMNQVAENILMAESTSSSHDPYADIPPFDGTVRSVLPYYLADMMNHGISSGIYLSRRNQLTKRFLPVIGNKTFDEVVTDDIESIYKTLRNKGTTDLGIYHTYAALNNFYRFAIRKGYTKRNTVRDAGIISEPPRKKPY